MRVKCPYCGYENIAGADVCGKCLHSLTHKDISQQTKQKFQKKLMTEKVSDFISKVPPIILKPNDSIQTMIEQMQALPSKGCVLICEKKKIVGIASIRDILLKVAGRLDPAKTPIKKIMTPKPECLDKDAPLSFALNKMSIGRFRHVPVLDGDTPIGVVSTRDLIDYLVTGKK